MNKGHTVMTAFETQDTNRYGARVTNDLVNGHEYHAQVNYSERMTLKQVAEAGGKITRVRVLTESVPMAGRFCDVSYVHATLPDGTTVDVCNVGVNNMTPMRELKGELIKWAKAEGVFAKGLGLLDEGNWSVCY
jgi:hypothetical protein